MEENTVLEKIQRELVFLAKEKEAERKEFLQGKPKSGFVCEEIEFYQENLWKVTASLPASFSKPDWFRKGAPAFLKADAFEGKVQIAKVDSNQVELLLRSFSDSELELDSFSLQAWFSETTYEILEDALKKLEAGKLPLGFGLLKKILESPKSQEPSPAAQDSVDLAEFLKEKDYAIVYGPPGTGKTTTLIKAIQAWKMEGLSVLALAPNNFAIDNLVELGAKSELRPVRLGSSAKIREEVLPFTFVELLAKTEEAKLIDKWKKEWKALQKKINSWKRNFGKEEREERFALKKEAYELMRIIRDSNRVAERKVIEEADFVASTFAGTSYLPARFHFDIVIIDEATQAWTSSCFLSATLGKKMVLAGDPKQLPPYQKTRDSIIESFLEKAIEKSNSAHVLFLQKQFRMPELLIGFSNQTFYGGKVQSVRKEEVSIHSQFASSLVFLDTAGSDTEEKFGDQSSSYSNPYEALFIIWILNQVDCKNITIITPYSGQVEFFQSHLARLSDEKKNVITIQTIDSFQGRESDLVILSLVRSNDKGEVGFLKEERRWNVALTRARHQMIVVGDSATLCQEKLFDRFLNYVKENGEIKSIFEFDWESA